MPTLSPLSLYSHTGPIRISIQIEKLQSKVHALEVELQHERLKSRPTTPIGASNSDPAELAILLDLTKQAENEVLRELVKDLKAQLNAQNTR